MAGITMLTVILNYMFDKLIIYLVAVILVSEVITWGSIAITNLKFHKKLGDRAEKLKYKVPFYPYSNYFCLVYFAFLVFLMTLLPDYRIGAIALPVWLAILGVAYKIKNTYNKK